MRSIIISQEVPKASAGPKVSLLLPCLTAFAILRRTGRVSLHRDPYTGDLTVTKHKVPRAIFKPFVKDQNNHIRANPHEARQVQRDFYGGYGISCVSHGRQMTAFEQEVVQYVDTKQSIKEAKLEQKIRNRLNMKTDEDVEILEDEHAGEKLQPRDGNAAVALVVLAVVVASLALATYLFIQRGKYKRDEW